MIIKNHIDEIKNYLSDASNLLGNAEKVYIPESSKEVSEILKTEYCKGSPITFSGAGTGVAGGRVPQGGIIISSEKLNKISNLDKQRKTITVQPGVTLEEVNNAANEASMYLPPNPTETLCSIGGCIAGNSSGARTYKYGSFRNWVRKINIILYDGDEIEIERGKHFANGLDSSLTTKSGNRIVFMLPDIKMPNVKHAAGYYIKPNMDLIDLFIGAEGTLGFISEIELDLLKNPEFVFGMIVFFNDENKLFDFVNLIKTQKGVNPRIIEYFDSNSIDLARKNNSQLPSGKISALWIEQECDLENQDMYFEEYYKYIVSATELAEDTWIASDAASMRRFTEFRHALPLQVNEIVSKNNMKKISTDTSVPDIFVKELYKIINAEYGKTGLEYNIFGHIGNSHFHANIFPKNEKERELALEAYKKILEYSVQCGGTISAEHGLGKLKSAYLNILYTIDETAEMQKLKRIFDPKNLINKGNIFRI